LELQAEPILNRITAFENVGAGSVRAPAVRSATTPNPETVFFKKKGR
jgi:hypothetical protein